jgi:hypothetical protein
VAAILLRKSSARSSPIKKGAGRSSAIDGLQTAPELLTGLHKYVTCILAIDKLRGRNLITTDT